MWAKPNLSARSEGRATATVMPKNRVIRVGIVVLAATVLLWIGAELTKRIEGLLPHSGGVAVAMIVGGFVYELWKSRCAGSTGAPPPNPTNEPPHFQPRP